MNWNQNKSMQLSKFCVYLFMVILVVVCVLAPQLFRALLEMRGESMAKLPFFLAAVYTTAVPAAAALWDLRKLLWNISCGNVFLVCNVAILRRLSWYCIIAGLIFFVSGFFYLPFFFLSIAAAFIGLILRVVKNVFSEAVALKDENDYTI